MRCKGQAIEIQTLGFISTKDEYQIKECLQAWGFGVNTTSKEAWSLPGEAADSSTIIMPVFGACRPGVEQFESAIKPYIAWPSVGIFFGELTADDFMLADRCTEFINWPCDRSELSLRLSRILQKRNATTINELQDFPKLLGKSAAFKSVLQQIDIFTQCSAPALIEGETGTGKEMVARAIHYKSQRADYPFIPVNCGALPDNLVENELFGHAKGAYTDAKTEQTGLIAQANGGTLLLDEIEALSMKAQVALLRFLQEHTYRPLGGNRSIQADVRIIAACNEDINLLLESGRLRQDLFFRLNILHVHLPALRERREDIPLLVQHFLNKYCKQYKLVPKIIASTLLDYLCVQYWPGNIRELENSIHRAVLMSTSEIIGFNEFDIGQESTPNDEINELIDDALCFNQAKSQAIDTFERQYLQRLMRDAQGNVTLAAKKARKERRALGKLLKKHGIERTDYAQCT